MMDTRSVELAVRPPGHAEGTLKRGRHSHRHKTSAAHRSAAMAGGARPDPFRTRKLSRRAPMVLRGQPVGEQGAADRWTALDPHLAGSGAGAPRGTSPRRPLLSFSFSICVRRAPRGLNPGAWLPNFLHIVQTRALRGPFSLPRGPAVEGRAPPCRPFAGRTGSSVSAAGGGRRLPHGAPPFPWGLSVGGNLKMNIWDCGGNPGPKPSYAAGPKSLRYCMGLL